MTAPGLAEGARAELAAIAPRRRCDRLAELSAVFHTSGAVHLRGAGRVAFHLDLAGNAAARRAFALCRSLRLETEIRTYARRAFEGATRFELPVARLARSSRCSCRRRRSDAERSMRWSEPAASPHRRRHASRSTSTPRGCP